MGNVFSDCVGIDNSKPALASGFQGQSTEDEASQSALEDASHLRSTSSMFTEENEHGHEDHENSSSDDDEDDDDESEPEPERSIPHAVSSKSIPSSPWDDIFDLSNQFYFDSSTDSSPWSTIGDDEDYRAFLLLIHPRYGLLLLHCTRKKNKPPHYQLPGGHVDEEDFEMHEQNLFMAAQAGAARELWEETGIDMRFTPAINRLLPLIVTPTKKPSKGKRKKKSSAERLPNEFKERLFFVASVTDDDFPKKTNQSKRLTRSRNHDIPLFLHLSVEHSGFWFERDPEKAIQLLQLHSGGKVSKALAMALKTATGDPALEVTQTALTESSDVRRNARWAPKGTTHIASPNQEPPPMSVVSPKQSPVTLPKVQPPPTPPESPERPSSPSVRITVGQQGTDGDLFTPMSHPEEQVLSVSPSKEQGIPVSSPKPPTPVQSRSKVASPPQSPARNTISPPSPSPSRSVTKMSPARSPSERTRSTDPPSLSRHSHDNNNYIASPKATSTMSWEGQDDETLLRPNPSAPLFLNVTVDSFVDSTVEHDQAIQDMLMEEFGSSVEEEAVNHPIPAVEQQRGFHNEATPEYDDPPFILSVKTDDEDVRRASDNLWAEEEALLKADVMNARQIAQKYSLRSEDEQASLDSPRMKRQARMHDEAYQKAEQEALIRAAQLQEKARSEAALRRKEEEEERKRTSLVDQQIRDEIEARQKAEEARADEKARREAAARQRAQEEARIQAEQAQQEEAARQKAAEEARIKAKQLEEQARRETEARQKAEEEARIKAIELEEKARKEAEARQKAEEEARIKAIELEEKARKEAEARQKAEQEARNKSTPVRARWQPRPSTPQDNRKVPPSPRPPYVKSDSQGSEEEVAQDILNEFTKQVNNKDGSLMSSSPRQSRQWPPSITKQQPQSPAQTPLDREKRRPSWTTDSRPATPKSPTQNPEKELLTAPYADIAKNKREKEELERQQAEDAFNKARQAKEAERLQKIQRLEEERKRMRKEEQIKASEERSRSATAAESSSSSEAIPSTNAKETEASGSCDRFILLISGSSGNPLQKVNQGRVVAMLQGKNLAYITVDGANPAETDRRNQLFNLSGIRGKYPQLFLEQKGQTTFVGDYDTIDDLNESGNLAKLLLPQRDTSSSSNAAADGVAPTASDEDELTVVNAKSLVILLSKVSGNYSQKANQERALVMLASNKIRPEIIDASDPSTVVLRNRLFGISGVRGNYPQFFLKHVETGEYSYVGNFSTIEGINDQGPLEEIFH